jgi:hypothetical protein
MTFQFRYALRACAGPTQKEAVGLRQVSLHASNVVEAADRFLRAQLERKRRKQFAQ